MIRAWTMAKTAPEIGPARRPQGALITSGDPCMAAAAIFLRVRAPIPQHSDARANLPIHAQAETISDKRCFVTPTAGAVASC